MLNLTAVQTPDRAVTVPGSTKDLVLFAREFECDDEFFKDATGVSLSALNRYRRGRSSEKPSATPAAVQRMGNCRAALRLVLDATEGDTDRALDWLYEATPVFRGETPLDVVLRPGGLELVSRVVSQMRLAMETAKAPRVAPSVIAAPKPTDQVLPTGSPAPAISVSAPRVSTPLPEAVRTPSKPSATPPAVPQALPAAAPVSAPSAAPKVPSAPADPPRKAPEQLRNPEVAAPSPTTPTSAAKSKIGAKAKTSPYDRPKDVRAEERCFSLRTRLRPLLEQKNMTQSALGRKLVEAGFGQFKSSSRVSAIANSYAYANWDEVVAIARILEAEPSFLAGTPVR